MEKIKQIIYNLEVSGLAEVQGFTFAVSQFGMFRVRFGNFEEVRRPRPPARRAQHDGSREGVEIPAKRRASINLKS